MSSKRLGSIIVAWGACVLVPAAAAFGADGSAEKPSLFTGDLGNIFWSLLTFAAVIFVLGKFAWKPILGALQKREDFIRDSLEQAKSDREEAKRQLEQYAQKLDDARAEATGIVEEGRRDAEVVKRRIEEEAKAQADAVLDRARREIGIATDTAVKELYSLSSKLAIDVASRIIRKELSPADHERLIADSIDELGRIDRN